jgi:REP element-mobilizing transposase RayT
MPSKKVTLPYESDYYYHIYNRGNNKERTFFKRENYSQFLALYRKYLEDYVITYCFVLIPNHFHFLIKVTYEGKDVFYTISNQLKKVCVAYTQIINAQEKRSGNLFQRSPRRIKISDQRYLKRLVFYMHNNPVKHDVTSDFKDYPYSSYLSIISGDTSIVDVNGILSWFSNDIEEFREYHSVLHDEAKIKYLLTEEG